MTPDTISILEQTTGVRFNARETYDDPNVQDRFGERFSLSYVTGSHALKFGFQDEQGVLKAYRVASSSNVSYTFSSGRPVSLTQYATPYELQNRFRHDMGIYAQDQWAIRRLTLNLGLRYDYFNGYVPAQHVAATPNGWLPERSYTQVNNVPLWKDLNPRIGGAYDLFGDGKTALKASLGRYVNRSVVEIANANNPIVASVNQVTRSWNDTNGNFLPDCDLANRGQNGECGPLQNQNFGNPVVTTRYVGFRAERLRRASVQLGHERGGAASDRPRHVDDRRLLPQLVRQLQGDGQPARCPRRTSIRSASRRPPTAGCPVAAATRSATLCDISPAKFGQSNNLGDASEAISASRRRCRTSSPSRWTHASRRA